ncbi:hypothetical protein LI328DRAFT_172069 [Trichoderma asperelloides]|nr:hypothetical protein LI328DRAFT_172069 [Trichoderma asperelloides]
MSQNMASLSLSQWRPEHPIFPLSPRQSSLGYPLWDGQGTEMRRTCSSRSLRERSHVTAYRWPVSTYAQLTSNPVSRSPFVAASKVSETSDGGADAHSTWS